MHMYKLALVCHQGQFTDYNKEVYCSAKQAAYFGLKIVDHIPAIGSFKIYKIRVSLQEIADLINKQGEQ